MSPKSDEIREMFNRISGQYDFLNHFLSFGIDRSWRKRVVKELVRHFGGRVEGLRVLDCATGTGDLAIAVAGAGVASVSGIDIAPAMMEIGREKAAARGFGGTIAFAEAAAEHIPFPDDTFDAVTVAFGVRNYEDLAGGLREMLRVTRPGGIVLVLEFSHPKAFPFRQLYRLYSRYVIPSVGKAVSGSREAYTYLPDSVAAFPSGAEFLAVMKACGMDAVRQIPLTFGVSSLYTGQK